VMPCKLVGMVIKAKKGPPQQGKKTPKTCPDQKKLAFVAGRGGDITASRPAFNKKMKGREREKKRRQVR